MSIRDVVCLCFNNFTTRFWNCSNIVVFFVYYFTTVYNPFFHWNTFNIANVLPSETSVPCLDNYFIITQHHGSLWPTNTKDLVECCSSDTSASPTIYTALRKAAMGNTMFINMTYLQYQRTFPSFADCNSSRCSYYSGEIAPEQSSTRPQRWSLK